MAVVSARRGLPAGVGHHQRWPGARRRDRHRDRRDPSRPELEARDRRRSTSRCSDSTGPAGTDQVGHGTHVASLACAATDNGIGIAGAGDDCRLVIEKTDFTDSSIAAAIVDATDRHVGAINMSFGPDPSAAPPAPGVRGQGARLRRRRTRSCWSRPPRPTRRHRAGRPGQRPAARRDRVATSPRASGLDVTAAQFGAQRASFAGFGSEISLAAYGAFNPDSSIAGRVHGAADRDPRRVPGKPHAARGATRPCRLPRDARRRARATPRSPGPRWPPRRWPRSGR